MTLNAGWLELSGVEFVKMEQQTLQAKLDNLGALLHEAASIDVKSNLDFPVDIGHYVLAGDSRDRKCIVSSDQKTTSPAHNQARADHRVYVRTTT